MDNWLEYKEVKLIALRAHVAVSELLDTSVNIKGAYLSNIKRKLEGQGLTKRDVGYALAI